MRVDGADPAGFALRAPADLDRERTGPAQLEACVGCAADRANACWIVDDRACWPFGSNPGATRFGDQQRLRAGAVEPDVVQALRRIRRLPGFGELERFQRRVGRHQRLDQRGGRRTEILDARIERVRAASRRPAAACRAYPTAGSDTGAGASGIASSPTSPLATSANSGLGGELRAQRLRLLRERLPDHRPTARPAAAANPGLRRVRPSAASARASCARRHEFAQVAAELQVLPDQPAGDEQQREPQQRQRQALGRRAWRHVSIAAVSWRGCGLARAVRITCSPCGTARQGAALVATPAARARRRRAACAGRRRLPARRSRCSAVPRRDRAG